MALRGDKRRHIFSIWPGTCSGGGGEQILRKGRVFKERKSNFSLNFPVFGSSDFVGPRSKVDLRYKGYAWAPVIGSFDKLRKVGVFSYLVYFLFKSHLKWFGLFEAVNDCLVGPKTWD